jgi:putative tryptophan/tyrosine transport system substrate-binding protein
MNENSWPQVLNARSDNLKSKSNPAEGKDDWIRIVALVIAFVCVGATCEAQPAKKIPLVGWLTASGASGQRLEAFRQGLRDHGYAEGKNILIESRFADGKFDRLPALVAELVRLNVEVIVSGGSLTTRPAKETTSTIPIVMTQDNDPVGDGFVASLARPGGNITGLSSYSAELTGKRLDILKETVLKLSRVAVLGLSPNPSNPQGLKDTEIAARALDVNIQYLDSRTPKDLETAFRAASKGRAEAVLVLNMPGVFSGVIPELAVKYRLPAIYYNETVVDNGGLMSYGASILDLDRRGANYVDKILKGAKPADLPVEQPTKFEFIVNLKAAKQIGLTIPPNVLARADRVIR